MTITILYDNNKYDERLETAWGFSCLVEGLEKTILFDTGGKSSILLRNMRKLEIDPSKVEVIIISHSHSDHLGGLSGFLQKNHDVTVYLPQSFPKRVKAMVKRSGAKLVEVGQPTEICKNVHSTGELGVAIKEQSLVIETSQGLIVITGCAHPGIVNIVKAAKKQRKKDVYLVLGGFHLGSMDTAQIDSIIAELKQEGVRQAAPCHCSGHLARRIFEEVYGENFILVGAGKKLELGGSAAK